MSTIGKPVSEVGSSDDFFTRIPMGAGWETWKREVLFEDFIADTDDRAESLVVGDSHRVEASSGIDSDHGDR